MNFWLLSPQSSITFFIRTMEGICTLQNHAKFCKITWEFAKWKMQERRGRWKQPTARRGVRPRVNVLLLITTGVFLFTINWTYPPHEVDLSSSSLDFFSSCNRSVLIIKWICPPHQLDFSSTPNAFFLIINWIFPPHQLDFYSSSIGFLPIIFLSSDKVGFSLSSNGFLLVINWISPPQEVDCSSLSNEFLILINWISPPGQVDFSSSSNRFFLIINWISPPHEMDLFSSSNGYFLIKMVFFLIIK